MQSSLFVFCCPLLHIGQSEYGPWTGTISRRRSSIYEPFPLPANKELFQLHISKGNLNKQNKLFWQHFT